MSDNKKSSISKRSSCYLLNLKQPEKTGRRLKLSFQRTAASVILLKSARTVEAAIGFLDVSEKGAGVFTPELLHKGALVEVCITEPAVLKVRGIVAWSIPVTSGIHNGKFNCRSGIQFVFDGEVQQSALLEFVRKAGMDPIENLKNSPPPPTVMQPGNNTDFNDPPKPAVDPAAPVPTVAAADAAVTPPPAVAAPGTETPPTTAEAAPATPVIAGDPAAAVAPAAAPAPTAPEVTPAPAATPPLAEAHAATEAAPAVAAVPPASDSSDGGQKAA